MSSSRHVYGDLAFIEPKDYSDKYSCYNKYDKFSIDRKLSEFCLFRTFAGGVVIKSKGEVTIQDTNYFIYPPERNNFHSSGYSAALCKTVKPASFEIGRFHSVFDGMKSLSNKEFFKEVLVEAGLALHSANKKDFVRSFLHIYRAVEHMSYAIPLICLSMYSNYKKTYEDFEALFKGGAGELGIGQKFIRSLMDENLYKLSCVIDFSDQPEGHYKSLKKIIAGKHNKEFVFDDQDSTVTFPFGKAMSLIKNVRNQYFHHLYSKDFSLSSNDIISPDIFFESLFDVSMSFLANFYYLCFSPRYR